MVKHRVKHSNYVDCLLNERAYLHSITSFRSSSHLITGITKSKISLTPYDDKCYLLDDGIHTLPQGYYKIPAN